MVLIRLFHSIVFLTMQHFRRAKPRSQSGLRREKGPLGLIVISPKKKRKFTGVTNTYVTYRVLLLSAAISAAFERSLPPPHLPFPSPSSLFI